MSRRSSQRGSFQERSFAARSFAARIIKANATVEDGKIWGIAVTIGLILVVVHSLSYVAVEYGMFGGRNEYSQYTSQQICLSELKNSRFDLLNTEDYYKWMDKSTVLDLAETGTYQGPDEIKEYAEFVKAPYFSFYKRTSGLKTTPILMADDDCSVNFVTTNKAQVKNKYQPENACLETVVGYTLQYTPKPFKINQINLFYSKPFLTELFDKDFDSNEIRDFVCNIMEANCQETFQLNNLTADTCRSQYDSLQSTNAGGYLDDNSKGCRILHSAFAAINKDHCPHLSFIPQEDQLGRVKCQKSKNKQPEDIFSSFELETIKKQGHEWGFDETLMRTCSYDPKAKQQDLTFGKILPFATTVPTEYLNDYQFLVYVGFVMYITMVLSGLGMEYLFWRIVLGGNWDEDRENQWKVAQFVFPLLGATTFGLAITGNYLALPFLVITMWKLGFPETIMLLYSALYDMSCSWKKRAADFVRGMGTICHHSSSALYVAMLVTHVLPPNRDVLAVTLPLVMQHWVVLLKYNYKVLYIVIEVIIEAWWEWTAFSTLPAIHELHWVGGMGLLSMLFAHWCYFGAGIFSFIALGIEEKHNEDSGDRMVLTEDYVGRLKRMSTERKMNAHCDEEEMKNLKNETDEAMKNDCNDEEKRSESENDINEFHDNDRPIVQF